MTGPLLLSIRLIEDKPIEETKAIEILNQLELPHKFEWIKIEYPHQAFDAIKSMKIRGAPAIGSLASLSLACGILKQNFDSVDKLRHYLEENSNLLISARPTAVNLKEAVQRVRNRFNELVLEDGIKIESIVKSLIEICRFVWEEDLGRNKVIGSNGSRWILNEFFSDSNQKNQSQNQKISVLTVCNTGSLATSGYGTALGVITSLAEMDRLEHVYYMQTGPYMQGARLTSLELDSLKIDSTMVCDTAAAYLIRSGKVDAFIAGADRIASNGDTANKVSTYQIALLCKHALPKNHHRKIPVVIAAPVTTFDLSIKTGDEIEIEQRPSIEAITARGKVLSKAKPEEEVNGADVVTVLITPSERTKAFNPAFDITPQTLIDGIVTELGVIEKKKGSHKDEDEGFDIVNFLRR